MKPVCVEELVERRRRGISLLLGLVVGLLDLLVGDLQAQPRGVGLVPVGLDQEVHHLTRQRREQLLAVAAQRLVGLLGEARHRLADVGDGALG